ncbi:MAG: OmpA family protein [Alphaproteobacteria bacterium]|nr:OmpA family protein [Alphaproteobacteria bacterium]
MNKYIKYLPIALILTACAGYVAPARNTWGTYLNGASFTDMTDMARVAKRPVFLGAGGQLVLDADVTDVPAEYGDKAAIDNARIIKYMTTIENELYDTLRKPGISVQRAGTDVVVILVRDAIMEINAAAISATGDDTLNKISKILNKYNATFVEIAGYTDAMRDTRAAQSLSDDMAKRVAVYLGQHGVNTTRMFIVGRGAARPIAAQDNVGRLMNRRVELRIVPAR